MRDLTVSLKIPQDILSLLDTSNAAVERHLLQLISLELFREGRISTGKGAELLKVSKWEFIQLLAKHNIPYFTESSEELVSEVAAVKHFLDANNK